MNIKSVKNKIYDEEKLQILKETPYNSQRSLTAFMKEEYAKHNELNDKLYEKDCNTLMMELVNFFLTNNRTLFKIFRSSGKDYNDFGRF